jgi:hypothetical protein
MRDLVYHYESDAYCFWIQNLISSYDDLIQFYGGYFTAVAAAAAATETALLERVDLVVEKLFLDILKWRRSSLEFSL